VRARHDEAQAIRENLQALPPTCGGHQTTRELDANTNRVLGARDLAETIAL